MYAYYFKEMTDNRNNLNKYAMQFGTYMGIFWIFKFILFPLGLRIPFLLFLGNLLTYMVPFLGYYYVRMFRDKVCGGSISFFYSWIFTILMYMFASLLVAVAHYFYFQFVDHGFVAEISCTKMREMFAVLKADGVDISSKQIEAMIGVVKSFTSFDITMIYLAMNMFFGSILAFPTALFVMKKKKAAL